jgi:rRNA maturation endonuclease Nob1
MDLLKPILSRYLDISKQLLDINSQAKELRENRQEIEMDLAAAYNEARIKEPLPDKIDLHKSRMQFVVKKPGEWKKGWTLSKKQLKDYLVDILPEHGEDVFKELVRRHEATLVVQDDYSFDLKPVESKEE